ncbi:PASTA domain-containing protein [Ligilactobacillus acidipiscis]|nr:PASTA domain-containing protein [Ligilactobacillus acidipiscis]
MGETAVTFQVSQGAKSFELRDLLNYTLKSAQDYADEKGLTLNVTRENSDKYDEGIVMQQEPAAGTVLNQGDTISVTISDGAKEESSAESSSSSSSSSSLADSTSKFAVSVKLPFEETNQGKSNKVQIYISDKSHQIKNIYQTLDITGDREVQIPFELEDGKKGAYKIVRDGQVIEEKDDVTQE